MDNTMTNQKYTVEIGCNYNKHKSICGRSTEPHELYGRN